MLFIEVTAIYSENHTKPINKNSELLIVTAGGLYSYHWALRGLHGSWKACDVWIELIWLREVSGGWILWKQW
jgi:hypothetical protein